MTVEEFLRILDEIRFDADIDEQTPTLRDMVKKIYPYLVRLYNAMSEAGYLNESVNEEHGNKKHNGPKTVLAAMKHGDWQGNKDIVGDGFKSQSKLHKTSKKDRKPEKINKFNYNKFVEESVNKTLKKFIAENIDDFGKYAPGLEVTWGDEVEKLIKKLSDIFKQYNAPEEDEYGLNRTAFDDLIANLKYYYEIDKFDCKVLSKIQSLLENYDLTQMDKVRRILYKLKTYC